MLAQKYTGELSISGPPDSAESQLEVSTALCRRFLDTIYDSKYDYGSGSKADRMRAFWERESNYVVGRVLDLLFTEWSEFRGPGNPEEPPKECLRIVRRLKESAPVPDIEALAPNIEDKSFEALARSVKQAIDRNEPESGLDRLHTFVVKYFRVLCEKRGIDTPRDKLLHSLVGEYVKELKREGLIESEMAERILKSSISVMEAFNRVRNEQSFAHDNKILNYHESLLIYSHVTSAIRFVEAIERPSAKIVASEADELARRLPNKLMDGDRVTGYAAALARHRQR